MVRQQREPRPGVRPPRYAAPAHHPATVRKSGTTGRSRGRKSATVAELLRAHVRPTSSTMTMAQAVRRPLAGRSANTASSGLSGEGKTQAGKAAAHGRRWRGKSERDAAEAAAAETADPLRLSEDWGADSPEAGFDFAEKGTRLAPVGRGRWALLEPEVEPAPPPVQSKALRQILPQRDEVLRRRRKRLGGGDTAADEVHRSEQPIMRANHTLSDLAREQRQFQALSASLNKMKSGGRPSIESMSEAWHRARQPQRNIADGGLGRGRSTAKRSSVLTMGPTNASYRRCGGGVPQRRPPVRLRPLSQPVDPDSADDRAAARTHSSRYAL
eukprot:COSAG03_NODE_3135_length_2188_cov_1092.177597_3_plen_327_part_01